MSTSTLGIDIAKRKFDVSLLREGQYRDKAFENTPAGLTQLRAWLERFAALDTHACLEATGPYGEALATFLAEQQIRVSVVNPAKIKGFAHSELARTKSDRLDARLIARFCAEKHPEPWQPLPAPVRELRALVQRLEALQGMHTQETNRLGVAEPVVQESLQTVLAALDKEIEALRKRIREHIDAHPDLRGKRELLESIPGVGEATIATVLAFFAATPERFTDVREVVAFVGLEPRRCESGSSVHPPAHISKTGHALVRKVLYWPAISALRYNPAVQALGERLKAAGKPGKVVVVAAMRKLVHLIWGVLKSSVPFDPNRCLAS